MNNGHVAPWTRVAILSAALAAALGISKQVTGAFIPTDPRDALIFQNALLLVVLGSAILEHKFTRPGDSVVNGLMGVVTLITVYGVAESVAWWAVFGYCLAVFVVAAVCTVASTGPSVTGWQRQVVSLTYRPSVVFGRARVLYSVVFLFGVFAFYGVQSQRTALLVGFWGVFIALWPLHVPQLLTSLTRPKAGPDPIGEVVQTDWPDLIRVRLSHAPAWDASEVALFCQSDGLQRLVIPLYRQAQAGEVIGTGLCGPEVQPPRSGYEKGRVFPVPPDLEVDRNAVLEEIRGEGGKGPIVGFVVEESSVGELRFETWEGSGCREGKLVWCRVDGEIVYYQITSGNTKEESLKGERRGFQVASASQLGVLDPEKGFRKNPWLPPMNTPVFGVPPEFGKTEVITKVGDFEYGVVPGSELKVGGPFTDTMEYHTAILGVTGSGKTELAFDLIRGAVAADIKVICVDITARYEDRLDDLGPQDLSIKPETSAQLSDKLFAVETGSYGAPSEKEALKQFADHLRGDVGERLAAFLADPDSTVGVITLEEISNTKATIFITELFLTGLLHYAKEQRGRCPRVLVVVEEAHTVIPEANTMGLGDYDSRGLVGKIAQVALQGRKYGVGLLVVAQRTATVSKTVLTQCNTIITLNTFDETSLGFLKNMYGRTHTNLIADLLPRQAVIYGKGVRAERPVMIEIPYDVEKATLGD